MRVRLSRPLLLLELVVGLVLLIACANLANLALAGVASREREMVIRRAVGASRSRLMRQLITENLLLATAGGACALIAARWMSAALLSFLPPDQSPAIANLSFELDWRVLVFATLLSLLTCLLFGLIPALRGARTDDSLASRTGAEMGKRHGSFLSRGLIVSEVAMCALLLMLAGVFLRSLQNLRGQDAGYDESGLLVADVETPREYPEPRRDQLIEQLRARAANLPGIEIAAYSHIGQLSGSGLEYKVRLPDDSNRDTESSSVFEQRISPEFLAAMGTRIIAGRDLTRGDHSGSTAVAIVNQAFARHFFQGRNPIGKSFIKEGGSRVSESIEIVGVAQDAKWVSLRQEPPLMFYRPYAHLSGSSMVRFAIRSSRADRSALSAMLVQIARSIDPHMAVKNLVPFREVVNRTLVIERLVAELSAAFSQLALLIAGVGLYGVLAYSVARRRREIGVRIAIGASPRKVEWMFLRESLIMLAMGTIVGLPAGILIARLASTILYGLSPADPLTAILTIAALTIVTVAAAYIPARRAARTDPMIALREE